MTFIVVMTLLGLVVLIVLAMLLRGLRGERGSRQDWREVQRSRETLSDIRDLALEYRVIDSSDLPYKLLDLIDAHKKEFTL